MWVIYNSVFPSSRFLALTIWPFVFARKELGEVDKNHEFIHGRQQVEVMIVSFFLLLFIILISKLSFFWLLLSLVSYYVLYCLEYTVRAILYGGFGREAYRNISFEQEAYENESNLLYLGSRRLFAWIFFIPLKTFRRSKIVRPEN